MRITRDYELDALWEQAETHYPGLTKDAFCKVLERAIARAPRLSTDSTDSEASAWAEKAYDSIIAELRKGYQNSPGEERTILQRLAYRLRAPIVRSLKRRTSE